MESKQKTIELIHGVFITNNTSLLCSGLCVGIKMKNGNFVSCYVPNEVASDIFNSSTVDNKG